MCMHGACGGQKRPLDPLRPELRWLEAPSLRLSIPASCGVTKPRDGGVGEYPNPKPACSGTEPAPPPRPSGGGRVAQ